MRLFCIDPGPTESGYVIYDTDQGVPVEMESDADNEWLIKILGNVEDHYTHKCLIEMITNYGQVVGTDVFNTLIFIGRCLQAYGPENTSLIPRREIKLELCDSVRAKDKNIRQVLVDRFAKTGGGKTPSIGTKKLPGPLYGIKSHAWSALALAAYWEQVK
jgi:hypothetical protein